MQRKIKIGTTYMHYKQHPVHVIGIALHSESLEEMVIYEKLEDAGEYKKGSIWVRPKKMFLEDVLVNGKTMPRFALVED